MACTNKDLYKSVRKCPGTIIRPGIKPKFLAIPLSQILAWPKLPDPGDTTKGLEELATYKGDFTLAADAKWHAVDLVALKSSITTETQGEAPSATFLNKGISSAAQMPILPVSAVWRSMTNWSMPSRILMAASAFSVTRCSR